MRRSKWEIALYLCLGGLIGFGVAAYRNFLPGETALAQQGEKEGGIFSPPGTSRTGEVTPPPNNPPFKGVVGATVDQSKSYWPPLPRAPKGAPNVLYIVIDDVGFAQLGCFGSPIIETPNLDKLAANGLRYNNFQTTALCSPSRSCMLTGRNHHSNAMACITEASTGFPGYTGRIPLSHAFLSEMLTPYGWAAFAIGKWHLTPDEDMNLAANRKWWPLGRGFDRFYGFLGGEADQWTPWLTYDNHFIQPPDNKDYHLVPDLVSKAKEFVTDNQNVAPDRPFMMYFCPGTAHAPHHVPQDWIAKYKGKFDKGWDNYREEALKKQIETGICPKGTKLSPHDPDVPFWKNLNEKQKRLYAHEMEVFAAYLSFTDHHIGQLIEYLREIGELDNTIIMVASDNGASAEGGPQGSPNENLFFNNVPQTIELALRFYNEWGSPQTYPHYAWGWAWAGNTPFRRWKRETARGGTSDCLIVHWPKGIKARGEIRHQFVHAIDMVPTILDTLNMEMPTSINGVTQGPIEGISFASTFDDPKAKLVREGQYFEMFAQRAIYLDGWRAYAPWKFGAEITVKNLEHSKWMLFNINEDFSESTDLAAKFPEKLAAMKTLWWVQANKYKVLPLDGRGTLRLAEPRPQMSAPRSKFVYYPGGGEMGSAVAADVRNRSFKITAKVTIPKGGAEGVLLANGGFTGGFTFFIKDKKLHYVNNYVSIDKHQISSDAQVPSGKVTLGFEFEATGPPQIAKGKGSPGIGRLYINGKKVGEGKIPLTCPIGYSLSGDGMCIGWDSLTPVFSGYPREFRFTGTIERVVVDLSGKK